MMHRSQSHAVGPFRICITAGALIALGWSSATSWSQEESKGRAVRREPVPQVRYALGEDSLPHEGVPQGKLEGPFLFRSRVIQDTVRKYWVSVPAQYDASVPACVLVFQDGARAINPNGVLRVPQVLDNLIAKKAIPVTIGIYITPGQRGTEFPDSIGTGNPDNRDREYDVLDDNYARMVIDEILPEVGAKYNLTKDAAGRAIGGSSSGGICAFTVAWHRPDQFRNVISLIGSFTDIHGGHVYPRLVREADPKPIRIFLQDGVNDNRSPNDPNRDWYLQNQAMVAALAEKKYDMAHVFGEGGHADDHGGAMLPEMLQWIWRDYPGVQSKPAEEIVQNAQKHQPERIPPFPNFDPSSTINPVGQWKWESNNNRMRRSDRLILTGERSKLSGQVVTTTVLNGETRTTVVPIENAEMVGNKLIFDVQREFRDQKFKVTMQGVLANGSLVGWSLSEFNGTPRDQTWRAEAVLPDSPEEKSLIGDFMGATDVGGVRHPGTTTYSSQTQSYELSGAGTNMWGTKDEFHCVWKKMTGDFILDANVELLGTGADPHRKLGWIIRSTLDSDAAYADVAVHGDGLTSLQYRSAPGGKTEQVQSTVKGPNVIRLARTGKTISMAVAKAGDALQSAEGVELDLGNEVYVGLFICSHNADTVERGRFSNVRITIPVASDFRPYRDYIGSRLEVLDVSTGIRTVVHTVTDSMQAPNWTPDGKALIYNRNGKLYRWDWADRSSHEIDTGFANRNNNDHVLSPDGKLLGISHHTAEHNGKSMVYTVPVGGGTPRLITANGPSYLHSWSPDGQSLIFTGQRNDELDIYRIPVQGGDEVRLTDAKGVDDGSEYTPDGKTIYFNSNRTGRMQIWKMQADGSNPTQVTNDEYNNWFPHVSPDGKQLVILSYPRDIDSADHPFYKPVALRLMPIDGGEPRVIGYLYGGQGTINVNSWSPDSQKIAFVSNSQLP